MLMQSKQLIRFAKLVIVYKNDTNMGFDVFLEVYVWLRMLIHVGFGI